MGRSRPSPHTPIRTPSSAADSFDLRFVRLSGHPRPSPHTPIHTPARTAAIFGLCFGHDAETPVRGPTAWIRPWCPPGVEPQSIKPARTKQTRTTLTPSSSPPEATSGTPQAPQRRPSASLPQQPPRTQSLPAAAITDTAEAVLLPKLGAPLTWRSHSRRKL
ncbi:uncharacterized protein LOC134527099 [Bacillus rossius redtenbacheri]|uniref:uncharacterized protein LOC134527099 n=1 Tax=Bacillus rossius redtenbacheri TaxID=93214 RepID=UPI002FDE8F47